VVANRRPWSVTCPGDSTPGVQVDLEACGVSVLTPWVLMELVVRVARLLSVPKSQMASPFGILYADLYAEVSETMLAAGYQAGYGSFLLSRLLVNVSVGAVRVDKLLYFLNVPLEFEGRLFVFGMLVGLIIVKVYLVAKKLTVMARVLSAALLCCVIRIMYTAAEFGDQPRCVDGCVVVAILLAAATLGELLQQGSARLLRLRWHRILPLSVCTVVLSAGALRAWARINMSTGYEAVWSYLAEQRSATAASSMARRGMTTFMEPV